MTRGLICPERRKFLTKTVPRLTLGAFGALALTPKKKALASFFSSNANPNPTFFRPPQPTPAATWGYNTLKVWNDFISPNEVDVNNTLLPGYNWYATNLLVSSNIKYTIPPSSFSFDASVMTLTPPANAPDISNLGVTNGSAPYSFVGNAIQPGGFYAEARFAYNPVGTGGSGPNWFAWDQNLSNTYITNGTFPANGYAELDLMEALGAPTPNLHFTDWTWYSKATQYENSNTSANVGNVYPNDGLMHSYGCLYVPTSKNSGTGLIQRYVDGVHQTNCDVTFFTSATSPQQLGTPQSGWMSCVDGATLEMLIGSQQNQWIAIDSVQVWQ